MFLKFLFFTPTKVAEIPPAIFLICYSNILLSYIYTPKRNIKYQKTYIYVVRHIYKGSKRNYY
jgi:hypothetical protein